MNTKKVHLVIFEQSALRYIKTKQDTLCYINVKCVVEV